MKNKRTGRKRQKKKSLFGTDKAKFIIIIKIWVPGKSQTFKVDDGKKKNE